MFWPFIPYGLAMLTQGYGNPTLFEKILGWSLVIYLVLTIFYVANDIKK